MHDALKRPWRPKAARRSLASLAMALGLLAAAGPAQAQTTSPTDLNRYLALLAQDPRSLYALTGAGEAALALGDARAAVGFFARANEVEAGSGRVKAGMGRALVVLQQPAEALRMFAEASRLGVPDRSFLSDRGFAYDMTGDQTRAQADYAAAIRTTPDDPILIRRYAVSLGVSGKWKEADAVLMPLLNRGDREAWRNRAFIYAMAGLNEKARSITVSTMPAPLASGIQPYMDRMTLLSPAQQIAAVHFGQFPAGVINRTPKPPVQLAEAKPPVEDKSRNRRSSRRDRQPVEPVQLARAEPTPPKPWADNASPTGSAPAARPQPATPTVPARPMQAAPSQPRLIETSPSRYRTAPTPTPMPAPVAAPTPAPRPVQPSAPIARPTPYTAPAAASAPVPNPAPAPVPTPPASVPQPAPAIVSPPAIPASAPRPVPSAPTPAPTPVSSTPAPRPTSTPVVVAPPASVARPAAPAVGPVDPLSPASPSGLPAAAPPSPASSVPPPRVDRTLADIFASIDVPAEERQASVAPVNLDEVAALQAEQRRAEAAAAAKAKAEADAKAKSDAKAKADAEAKAKAKREADEKEKARKANPARIWVQIATGRDPKALQFDMRRFRKQTPAVLAGKDAWTADWGQTRRLIIGPFATKAKANAWMAEWNKAGSGGAFLWESSEGLEVEKLP